MTDARASLKNYRQSPRKVRLVADLVRGKSAERAFILLAALPKRASGPLEKLLKSAVANAQSKQGLSASELVVSKVEVNGGTVLKRSMPRARGRASQILKRTSHITLGLSKRTPKPKPLATSHYFPLNTGSRFSKNALRASAASFVENARRMLASSKRT